MSTDPSGALRMTSTRPRGRPSTLPEPWHTLAEKAGGVGELAERLGVSVRALRDWAHGKAKPIKVFDDKIKRLAKKLDVKMSE